MPTRAAIPLCTKPVLFPSPADGRRDPVLQGVVLVRFRADHIVLSTQTPPPLPIKFLRAEPLLRWEQSLHANVQRSSVRPMQLPKALAAEEPLLRTFILEYAEPWQPEYVCKLLQTRCPAVEVAEPYVIAHPLFTPNDPLLQRQQLLWTINAFNGWDLSRGDTTVVIGIVDTGTLITHEDLAGSLWTNWAEIPDNGIDDDGNGYVDDYRGYNFAASSDGTAPGDPRNQGEGHGTSVAGIAAATVNNGIGIAGVGFRCRFFPIKAAPDGVPAIYYGYQGILYCALMGFAVVNCSWGSRTASCINQSVVNYALARGTVVVAGAGNTPEITTAWYPAGYPGVIGVGNTYPNDQLQPQSGRGIGATVLAPGEGAWTTQNDGGYGTFGGASAATPIVSAAVALLRSLRPGLEPLQILALVRRTADDVSAANPDIAPLLPGRLNLWSLLAAEPEEAPGLVLPELRVRTADGRERRRWFPGDTLYLWLSATNVLGSASAVSCRLTIAHDPMTAMELLDTVAALPFVPVAAVEFGPFRCVVRLASEEPVLVRAELRDSSGVYRDVLFTTLLPTVSFATFANAVTSVSLADDGALGFADYPQNTHGLGFRYREWCGLLYGGGLFATDSLRWRAISAAPSGFWRDRDFTVLKPFAEPEPERNLISDASAPAGYRIGLVVQHTVLGFAAESSGVLRVLVTAWNAAGIPLEDVALGYLMDWDAGSSGRGDRARYCAEATVPDSPLPHGAEVVEHPGAPSVGAAVVALTPAAEPQCAGFNIATLLYDSDGFSVAEKIRLLSSGTAVQYADTGDVGLVVGVRFRGLWLPEEKRQFLLCFGAAESTAALAAELRECIRYGQTLNVQQLPSDSVQLLPAEGALAVDLPAAGEWTFELWDLLGRLLWRERRTLSAGRTLFELPPLPAGLFVVRLCSARRCWHQSMWVYR